MDLVSILPRKRNANRPRHGQEQLARRLCQCLHRKYRQAPVTQETQTDIAAGSGWNDVIKNQVDRTSATLKRCAGS
jgi:hypothetical protein